MSSRVASFFSVILHPVWMPLYTLILLLQVNSYLKYTLSVQMQVAMYLIVFLNTVLLPLLVTYILFRKGWVRSLDMEDREERLVPYMANALCLLLTYYLLKKLQAPNLFCLITLGAVASVVLAIIINLRWKISIHMIGIGGLTGILFGLSTFLLIDLHIPIIFTLLVAGFLGTVRLSLMAHNPAQIYTGFFLGFICEYMMLSV